MKLPGGRSQVLGNCKCLYGSDVELVTFSIGDVYQAVAMKYDPFTGSWTKFLHSKGDPTSTTQALKQLLQETEIELTKLFSSSGITLPFSGDPVQTLNLRRGVGENAPASNSAHSEDSGFELVMTSASTNSEETIMNNGHIESNDPNYGIESTGAVEELICEDPPQEHLVDPVDKEENIELAPAEVLETFSRLVYDGLVEEASIDLSQIHDEAPPQEAEPEIELSEPIPKKKKGKGKKGKKVVIQEEIDIVEETGVLLPDSEPTALDHGSLHPPHPDSENLLVESELESAPKSKKKGLKKEKAAKKKGKKGKGAILNTDDETQVLEEANTFPADLHPTIQDTESHLLDQTNPDSLPVIVVEDEAVVAETEPAEEVQETLMTANQEPALTESEDKLVMTACASTPEDTTQCAQSSTAHTVVLTIRYGLGPDNHSEWTKIIMVDLTDNTKSAILKAVNSYLNVNSGVLGIVLPQKVEIKYGTGKNGEVDLSGLEGGKWPEYLDYFSRCTGCPELTVDVWNGFE